MLQLARFLKEERFQLCGEKAVLQIARSLKVGEFQLYEWESSATAS